MGLFENEIFHGNELTPTEQLAYQLGLPENLVQRAELYIPNENILKEHPFPTTHDLHRRDELIKPELTKARYLMVFDPVEGKPLIIPTWHPINTTLIEPNHGGDYGSGVFEGGSLEPYKKNDVLVGANLILHEQRFKRIGWSMSNRFFDAPNSLKLIDLATRDLAAIIGSEVLVSSDGDYSRAYLRPALRPGPGELGIQVKKGHQIDAASYLVNWPFYFKDNERIYHGDGLVVAALPEQRLMPLRGKHASSYGDVGRVGRFAREVIGVDEALLFGPYAVVEGHKKYINFQEGLHIFRDNFSSVVLCDGPGEGLIALTKEGKIIYPPEDVNQLPSTTMWYITQYLAPRAGYQVSKKPKPFTLNDVNNGDIVGLAFVGNAARVAPIGKVQVHTYEGEMLASYSLDTKPFRALSGQYEKEVTGRIEPSHQALLTAVDINEGRKSLRLLDEEVFRFWMGD